MTRSAQAAVLPDVTAPRRRHRGFALDHLLALIAAGLFTAAVCAMSDSGGGRPQMSSQSESAGVSATTTPIAALRVGDWVLAQSPPDGDEPESPCPSADPSAWRQITFELNDPDTHLTTTVALLRPAAWVIDHDLYPNGSTWLDMPELSAAGDAVVTSLGPCPRLKPRPGPDYRLVTGTFKHQMGRPQMSPTGESVGNPDTVPTTTVVNLRLENLDTPIGVTLNHPVWCEEAAAFIPVSELQVGHHLRDATGAPVRLTAIEPRAGPIDAVYNLEVQGRHVYHVSSAGILVHNKGGEGFFAKYFRPSARNRGFALTSGRSPDHHPVPKFMGGNPKQIFENLPKHHHVEFHSRLSSRLRAEGLPPMGGRQGSTKAWGQYMSENPDAQRKAFDAVLDVSRAMDMKYGTNITQAVWKNIIDGNFTPY